jgi:hypothetical protein
MKVTFTHCNKKEISKFLKLIHNGCLNKTPENKKIYQRLRFDKFIVKPQEKIQIEKNIFHIEEVEILPKVPYFEDEIEEIVEIKIQPPINKRIFDNS